MIELEVRHDPIGRSYLVEPIPVHCGPKTLQCNYSLCDVTLLVLSCTKALMINTVGYWTIRLRQTKTCDAGRMHDS